jgi:hypothetical protein
VAIIYLGLPFSLATKQKINAAAKRTKYGIIF